MTEGEWLSSPDPTAMLDWLRANKVNRTKVGRRKLRLFGWSCGLRVGPLMSERGHSWLDLGQQCAERKLTSDEKRQIEAQQDWLFEEPGSGVALESWRIERAADSAAWFTLESNVMIAATVSAHNAAMALGIKAVPSGRSGEEHAAERKAQSCLLRDIFGNPFRPVTVHASWLAWSDGTVVKLAQGIYADRAFDRLPVLADALEEAGCDNAAILDHCRQPGVHAKGCWVVDLLSGKE